MFQWCSTNFIRRIGRIFFIVTLDLIGIAEQLRYSDARLHIVGSSSFVKGDMVQALDIHLSLCRQDSVIEKFPLLEMVIV